MESQADRLFLDANVLFSADTYRKAAGVAALWHLENTLLSSSNYAVEEAMRNLAELQQERLEGLLSVVQLVGTGTVPDSIRKNIELPEKDWPIVGGALSVRATHLITGDLQHVGPWFRKPIGGVLVLPPAEYMPRRRGDL